MYRTTTGLALKKTAQSWIKRWRKPNRTSHPANLRRLLKGKRVGGRLSPPADRRLLYAADGSGRGLCIALSFAFGIKAFEVKDTAAALMQIGGGSAFALMVPVLAGFIAFPLPTVRV